jgi:hypothetical protein
VDIVRAFAGARVVRAGGRPYLVSPPSLRGLAQLAAFLGDAAGDPSGVGRFADPETVPRLISAAGLPHCLYVATRRDHPDLTLDDCRGLAAGVAAEDLARLAEVVLCGGPPEPAEGDDPGPPSGGAAGVDLALAEWGTILEELRVRRGVGYAAAAEMSFDQLVNARRGGPAPRGRPMTFAEVLALYEANRPGDGAA